MKNYENEEEKWRWKKWTFFCWLKNSHIHYTKTSNLENFKYVTIFLISLLHQKIQLVKVSQKRPKMGILSLLWKAVTFVPVKISKRWLHIWNCLSLKFSYSEYENFSFSKKKFIFFIFIFLLHFHYFSQVLMYHFAPLKHTFPTRYHLLFKLVCISSNI